jgi:Mg2+-importing ATPase
MKYVLMGTSSNFGNMLSMAGASLFLPFLPLLPAQLLLNTLLYDLSQFGIPKDHVDADFLRHPQRWNTSLIRHFMLVLGPISSLFDFLTFAVLLKVFQAGPELFHAGWFVESLTTQVLVIYVIRTAGTPWSSRPHPLLLVGGIGAVLVGSILPLTSLGRGMGFAAPSARFYLFVVLMSLVYLSVVQFVKVRFYRRYHLIQ